MGRTFGRLKRRWEDNIKMGLTGVGWGAWAGSCSEQGQVWRALLNAVMHLRVPQNAGNVFSS